MSSKPIYIPISKADAKLQGLKRYYTGKQCKKGHQSERYVSTGHCIECSFELLDADRKNNPGKYKRWYHSNPENYRKGLFSSIRSNAKKRNLIFELTLDDLQIPSVCPIFSIPLIPSQNGHYTDNSPSVDRIDSTKGYVKGNVLVVSWKANRMKNNSSIEDLKTLTEFYTKLTY